MSRPILATEIEFYLHGAADRFAPDHVVEIIQAECARIHIGLASAEKERGNDQYEVALLPSHNKIRVIEDTNRFKALMAEVFQTYGVTADFSAKPLPNQPGSGLHVHVHMEENGRNLFYRSGEDFSPYLLHAIGGLLALMNPYMHVFAPYEESYARFCAKSHVPTTVSWGTNNRTTAIRLPSKPLENKHIEHRVSGSDADVAQVINAILHGIEYGTQNHIDPGKPTYGDAALPQYALPKLARNLSEAKKYAADFFAARLEA